MTKAEKIAHNALKAAIENMRQELDDLEFSMEHDLAGQLQHTNNMEHWAGRIRYWLLETKRQDD